MIEYAIPNAAQANVKGSIFFKYLRKDIGYPSLLSISSDIRIVIDPRGVNAPPIFPERTKPIHKPVGNSAGKALKI